uniref:Uncharacterized protein n=1 Tax=Anguilla anguilla TaxID=7936 RepID=A0A0E9UIA1_ANGAN
MGMVASSCGSRVLYCSPHPKDLNLNKSVLFVTDIQREETKLNVTFFFSIVFSVIEILLESY